MARLINISCKEKMMF